MCLIYICFSNLFLWQILDAVGWRYHESRSGLQFGESWLNSVTFFNRYSVM